MRSRLPRVPYAQVLTPTNSNLRFKVTCWVLKNDPFRLAFNQTSQMALSNSSLAELLNRAMQKTKVMPSLSQQ